MGEGDVFGGVGGEGFVALRKFYYFCAFGRGGVEGEGERMRRGGLISV